MANNSEYWGTLSVQGPWEEEDLNTLEDVLIYYNTLYYNFWTNDFNKATLALGDSIPLYGCGRWSIETNIRMFFKWARMSELLGFADAVKYSSSMLEYNLRLDKLIEHMEKNNLVIIIEGYDLEGGMDFIYSFTASISVLKGEIDYTFIVHEQGVCTLVDYTNITNDDEYLTEIVGTLLTIFNMPDSYGTKIYDLIKAHNTMYGITLWAKHTKNFTEFLDSIEGDDNAINFKKDMEQLYLDSLKS